MQYGSSPKGVDWKNEKDQITRFEQLCKVIEDENRFAINDIGCGYGALYQYLLDRYSGFTYCGIDISEDMITAAKRLIGSKENVSFDVASIPSLISEFSIASGIFNVKLEHDDSKWHNYIITTLDMMDRHSTKGFAFNCLTSYSDADKMRGDLYYADPCLLFDHCKRNYSKWVALLHDYGLWEFTVLVRKE
jgi:SAM-dependent methyltransferase